LSGDNPARRKSRGRRRKNNNKGKKKAAGRKGLVVKITGAKARHTGRSFREGKDRYRNQMENVEDGIE